MMLMIFEPDAPTAPATSSFYAGVVTPTPTFPPVVLVNILLTTQRITLDYKVHVSS